MTKCGIPYSPNTLAPRYARYVLCYWEYIIFATSKSAAETYQGLLTYHQAENSQIITIQEYRQNCSPVRLRATGE